MMSHRRPSAGAPAEVDRRALGPYRRHAGRWSVASRRGRRWPSDRIVLPAALLVAVAAVVLRRPQAVLHPAFWAEDGHVWFAAAYQQGPWRPLLEPHTGYLQTFPRLVADVGLLLPVRSVPLLFAAVAVVVQALPAVVVVSRRFDALVPLPAARVALAALYLAVPNASEVDANLTDAQWHLAILALVCLLATPAGRWWRAFDVAVVVLSGLTGPFVVVLAVVGGLWVWRGPRHRWSVVLWAGTVALAAVQAAELLSHRRSTQHLAALGASPGRLVAIVGGQIGLGGLLGSHAAAVTSTPAERVVAELVGLAVVLVVWGVVLCTAPLALRLVVVFGTAVLAAALVSPVASTKAPQWSALAHAANSRYWLVPVLTLLVSAFWLSGRLGRLLRQRLASRTDRLGRPAGGEAAASSARRRLPRFGRGVAIGIGTGMGVVALAAAVAVGMPADWRMANWPTVGEAQALQAFVQARPGQVVVVPTDPPGWRMVLRKH